MPNFQGLPTQIISNEFLSLEFLKDAGPRIVRLSAFGKENLFADIPDSVNTQYGEFLYRGGHRIWLAPESLPRTYVPDNERILVEEISDGVRLIGKTEKGTGISKSINIHLAKDMPRVSLVHTLENNNLWEVELAPWAITLFRLGGIVILPQPIGNVDPHGLLNNRMIALWPYTHVNDPRLVLRDDFILILGNKILPKLKIGYFNSRGWMAYWIDGVLFRKTFDILTDAVYPDGGCNSESYCCDRFVELESLGPLVKLMPGGSITFTETWEIYPKIEVPFLTDEIRELIIQLG